MENNSDRFQTNPNYIHRNIAGKSVLISVGGNIANFNGYIQLNETAAFLWQQLDTPKTIPELVSAMREEFDVSKEAALADVKEFLDELAKSGMVSADE